MKISVITVCYQSEKTLGSTIESLLEQTKHMDNPTFSIEYLIIDGASKDGTLQVAEKYREELEARGVEYRVYSEKDKGIYDAMNKGIRLATGDVIGILNSDDWYEPDTLQTVARTFEKEECDLMFANIRMHKQDGSSFIKKARQRR